MNTFNLDITLPDEMWQYIDGLIAEGKFKNYSDSLTWLIEEDEKRITQ
jgi:Arc/MetJ-type ribon-helix-helix transcriptional regulator